MVTSRDDDGEDANADDLWTVIASEDQADAYGGDHDGYYDLNTEVSQEARAHDRQR